MVVAHWMMLFLGWMLLNLSRTSSTSFNNWNKNFLKKDFQATSQSLRYSVDVVFQTSQLFQTSKRSI